MRRRRRAGGSAIVAVVALSLSVSSAARATIPLTTSAYPATVAGSQAGTQTFTLAAGRKVTCRSAHVRGKLARREAEAGELTLVPAFGECSVVVLGVAFPTTVTPNNCEYFLRLTSAASGPVAAEGWEYTGAAKLTCVGTKLEIHVFQSTRRDEEGASLCTYAIGSQGLPGSVDFKIEGAGRTLAVRSRLEGISAGLVRGTLVNCGPPNQTASYSGQSAAQASGEVSEALTFSFN